MDKEQRNSLIREKPLEKKLSLRFRISWLLLFPWIKTLEDIKIIDLKKAWKHKWTKVTWINPIPKLIIIIPNWLVVLKAITFFMSNWLIPHSALDNIVNALSIVTNSPIEEFKLSHNRISKNTPATTIVEEWSNDETGVGLSIALGNQGWKKNWEDLAIILKNKKKKIKKKK